MRVSRLLKGTLDLQGITDWLKKNKLGIILLPWLAAAGCVLFEKIFMMVFHHEFLGIAMSLRTPPAIYFWERVSLYKSDILCYFVLIPLAFCALTSWLSPRWRIFISILAALFVEIVVTVEALTYVATDGFSSFMAVLYSVLWAVQNHDAEFFYYPARMLALVTVFVVLFSGIALFAGRRNIRWLNHAALAAFGFAAAAAAIAYIPRVPAMPWSQSLLQISMYQGFFKDNRLFDMHSRSVPELLQTYRESSHTSAPGPTDYTGKAKNYNVILILMESMSAQAFDPARDSLNDMPNVRRLRDQSFLMGRHYTSYPVTDNATFSIFTSLYMHTQWGTIRHLTTLPGFIRAARDDGYKTGFYGFVWTTAGHRDDLLLASLGFEKIAAAPKPPPGISVFFGPLNYVETQDHSALHSMQMDIHEWTARRQKFAAVFFPEMGHDPYRELDGHTSRSIIERGHALAVYQDAWLGELLDELQRDGALDNTIIVITGDHGMRCVPGPDGRHYVSISTRGMLEDITMRVPMLIYVPGVLKHSIFIDSPTSHIDITPTLLDLMGFSAGRELEQGSPVYSPGIDKRRLFLEMDFLGASGFYDAGSYYSSSIMGVVYKNSSMDFSTQNELPYDSKDAENVRGLIEAQDANQNALLSFVLAGQSVHGAIHP
jgi:phosphoglycerol transferase MdoB-like AlkP superfamily enzyme